VLARLVTPTPERETYDAFQQCVVLSNGLLLDILDDSMPSWWLLVSTEAIIISFYFLTLTAIT